MKEFLDFIDTKYIDFLMVVLVIASGLLQEKFLVPFTWYRADKRYDATLKTFVVSVIICGIYIWLWKYEYNAATPVEQRTGVPWIKFFISFGLATSFYDLIVRLFKKKTKEITGVDMDQKD